MSFSFAFDWLSENSQRAYPLKEQPTHTADTNYVLTNDVIVDAAFVYTTMPVEVLLTTITVDSTNVVFNCTGGVSFTVPKASTFPYYCRLSSGHLLVVGEACVDIPIGTHTFTNAEFEYGVIYEFGGEWLGVSSLQFDNSTLLTGDVNFAEGYQFGLEADNSTITMSCGTQYGTPIACNSFSESVVDCSDIISYINGVGPDGSGVLRLENFGGITILDDPEEHRIFIGLLMNPSEDVCKDIPINPIVLNP